MRRQLRVAIIGGGKMALQHAAAIRLQADVLLVAVADPFVPPEDLAARFGGQDLKAYNDARHMLVACKPDIVHIVTPPASHVDLARLCLEHGASIYVEKPFALDRAAAEGVLALAQQKGLKVCAAHQVLFQRAGQAYSQHLNVIGSPIHVESYFSFKPVRRRADGGSPTSAVEQLIDILPHPVYLLLSALGGSGKTQLAGLDVHPDGEVRALVRRGETLATLVVTLRGRPVESYLRVIGSNGSVHADFVLGYVVDHPGPGASGPSLVVKPFSQSVQVAAGAMGGLMRRIFGSQKSYPGLAELLGRFYAHVRDDSPAPMTGADIIATVDLCERISLRLIEEEARVEREAMAGLAARAAALPALRAGAGVVFLTGGTGFLGQVVARGLRAAGLPVRIAARRVPAARRRIPGVEYVEADLGAGISPSLLEGVATVVHLAAETAGDQRAHERNTVVATRNLLDSMQAAGVRRLVNASSVAVLRPSSSPLRETSPMDRGNLGRGPYVWAKAEAEAEAQQRAQSGALEVRTIRLGPLVDYGNFTAPGRLGREVARVFVAMGSRSNPLSVCDVCTAADVIRAAAEDFAATPPLVNLLEVPAPTRGELVARLRAVRPDLKFLWMPFPVLKVLSLLAIGLQKVLKPSRKPLDLYAAFKSERYDATVSEQVIRSARG